MEGSGPGSRSGSGYVRIITDRDPRGPKTYGSGTLLYTIRNLPVPGFCNRTQNGSEFNFVCGFGSNSIWNADPDPGRQYFKKNWFNWHNHRILSLIRILNRIEIPRKAYLHKGGSWLMQELSSVVNKCLTFVRSRFLYSLQIGSSKPSFSSPRIFNIG